MRKGEATARAKRGRKSRAGSATRCLLGTFLTFQAVAAGAAVFYVAPNGSPGGDGSASRPWDLQTALSRPATVVPPGSEIQLNAGTYVGIFTSTLAGTEAAPIVIKPVPGASVRLDGFDTGSLTEALPAATAGARGICKIGSARPLAAGTQIDVNAENMVLMSATAPGVYDCLRGWNGTPAAAQAAGSRAIVGGAAVLKLSGPYVWVQGLEITSSFRERRLASNGAGTSIIAKPGGLWLEAPGVKAINNVIHDVGHPGIGFFAAAKGCLAGIDANGRTPCAEIYGNIVYGVGYYDATREARPIGAGVYTQNDTGTKYVRDNVFFRNFTTGVNIYTQDGYVRDFHVEGNTSFDNGMEDIWATGGHVEPMRGLKVLRNMTFKRRDSAMGGIRFGHEAAQGDVTVVGNYVVKGGTTADTIAIGLNNFATATVTDNVFVVDAAGFGGMASVSGSGNRAGYTWTRNRYFDAGSGQGVGAQLYSFLYQGGANALGGGYLLFDDPGTAAGKGWRQWSGFDRESTYSRGLPTVNQIFVRRNAYAPGRGNVTVYNWERKASIALDLSSLGLAPGQAFEVRDAQNFFGASLAGGTYNGSPVTVPLANLVAAPLANCSQITHLVCNGTNTGPIFHSLVVVPLATNQTVSNLAVVNAASYATGNFAGEQMVAGFAASLPTASINITTADPKDPANPRCILQLGGRYRVDVVAGGTRRKACMFFVGGASRQVNFALPAGIAAGSTYDVEVMDGTTPIARAARLTAAGVHPGIFTANALGSGAASGYVLAVVNGTQQYLPIDPAKPISLASIGSTAYLVLFGTGIRNRPDLARVTATVGRVVGTVDYAGPQLDYVGVDQINVKLSIPQLVAAGAVGTVKAMVTVGTDAGTLAANPVDVYFK